MACSSPVPRLVRRARPWRPVSWGTIPRDCRWTWVVWLRADFFPNPIFENLKLNFVYFSNFSWILDIFVFIKFSRLQPLRIFQKLLIEGKLRQPRSNPAGHPRAAPTRIAPSRVPRLQWPVREGTGVQGGYLIIFDEIYHNKIEDFRAKIQ